MSAFERWVRVSPAYDTRQPGKRGGFGAVRFTFYLRGSEGAVQFKLTTQWYLPHVQRELSSKNPFFANDCCGPIPSDLGYHSYVPRYEGHTPIAESCDILGGRPCYYDGSTLEAERVYDRMLREGDEAVWDELEVLYRETFGHVPEATEVRG